MNKLKVLSLFSGIGAFEKALIKLNIPHEIVAYSEIDKYASKAYSIIHNVNEKLNLGDISKVDETKLPKFDLMTYGFPCQPFSVVGNKYGFEDPKNGHLFFESMKIAKEKKPKYMIAENVKNILNHNNGSTLKVILSTINSLGYNNYYKVLNSSDFGIPQFRERIFIISIRKDIDNGSFNFPDGEKLQTNFYDYLDDKNEINSKCFKGHYFNNSLKYKNFWYDKMTIIKLINNGDRISKRNDGLIYTLTASGRNNGKNLYICELKRVLTPSECFKFMGFEKRDVDKLKLNGISDTQLYKMAGNSIVVNVLEALFKNLLKEYILDKEKELVFV